MKINKKSKVKAVLSEADLGAIADIMGGLMDKQAAVLASKEDLRKVESRLDSVEINMATKQDLADLKSYMGQGFESVMAGMDAISEKLAEKEKVDRMEAWIKEASPKLGVKYQV